MKICIVGAGAIGGLTGAWFARAGHDVCLVARGAHLEALRGNGLTLVAGEKRAVFPLRASDEPADFGVQDAVFICLKAYSIAAMLPRLKTLVGPDTVVVPAINGLPWWYFFKEGGRLDGQPVDCLDPAGEFFAALDPKSNGSILHTEEPGIRMGWMQLSRGHQAMLPAHCAYQFVSANPSVMILQTCKGPLSIERWAEICQKN